MDGGEIQRNMAEQVKAQIQNGSSSRRERRTAEAGHRFVIVSGRDFADESPSQPGYALATRDLLSRGFAELEAHRDSIMGKAP